MFYSSHLTQYRHLNELNLGILGLGNIGTEGKTGVDARLKLAIQFSFIYLLFCFRCYFLPKLIAHSIVFALMKTAFFSIVSSGKVTICTDFFQDSPDLNHFQTFILKKKLEPMICPNFSETLPAGEFLITNEFLKIDLDS